MTSLAEVAILVAKGNEEQQETSDTLKRVEKGFDKFFSAQEKDRLDRLEDRLDAARTKRAGTSSGRAGAAAGFAAGAAGTAKAASAAFGGLRDWLLFLANPLGWAKALARVTFGLGAAVVGTSYKLLRNAIDDRLKTQRGLLRLEANELKSKKAEIDKRLKAEASRASVDAAQAKILMKKRIAAAEAEFKVARARADAEALAKAKAARAAQVRAARLDFERAQELKYRAREERKAHLRDQRNLKAQVWSGDVKLMRLAIDDVRSYSGSINEVDGPKVNAAPKLWTPTADISSSIAADINTAPRSISNPNLRNSFTGPESLASNPNAAAELKDADALKRMSDAQLADVSIYREVDKNGNIKFKNLSTHRYVAPSNVLKDIKARMQALNQASGESAIRGNGQVEAGRGSIYKGWGSGINRYGNLSVRGGAAILSPVEAAIQEGLEAYAKSARAKPGFKGYMGKTAGFAARVVGSLPFMALSLIASPKTLDDDTIYGPIEKKYGKLVQAILSGKYKDVAAALEDFEQTAFNLLGDLTPERLQEMGPLYYKLKSLTPENKVNQGLKSFVNMQFAKKHGRVNRGAEGGGAGYTVPKGYGTSGIDPRKIGYKATAGDEISALDGLEYQLTRFGQKNAGGNAFATTNNNQVNANVSVSSDATASYDILNGGKLSQRWFIGLGNMAGP